MNTSILFRALAALCLLCVLPKLGALTITQTASFNVADQSPGNEDSRVSAAWSPQQFSPRLGTLTGATLLINFYGTATSIQRNPFDFPTPMPHRSTIEITSIARILDDGQDYWSDNNFAFFAGPLVEIAPNFTESYAFSRDFNLSYIIPNVPLAAYTGIEFLDILIGGRSMTDSRWGSNEIAGTIDVALTYTYHVTDEGSSLFLVLVGLGAIWMLRAHGLRGSGAC